MVSSRVGVSCELSLVDVGSDACVVLLLPLFSLKAEAVHEERLTVVQAHSLID